jgi:hypothetical protein
VDGRTVPDPCRCVGEAAPGALGALRAAGRTAGVAVTDGDRLFVHRPSAPRACLRALGRIRGRPDECGRSRTATRAGTSTERRDARRVAPKGGDNQRQIGPVRNRNRER